MTTFGAYVDPIKENTYTIRLGNVPGHGEVLIRRDRHTPAPRLSLAYAGCFFHNTGKLPRHWLTDVYSGEHASTHGFAKGDRQFEWKFIDLLQFLHEASLAKQLSGVLVLRERSMHKNALYLPSTAVIAREAAGIKINAHVEVFSVENLDLPKFRGLGLRERINASWLNYVHHSNHLPPVPQATSEGLPNQTSPQDIVLGNAQSS